MRLFHKIFTIACLSSAAAFPGLAQADTAPPAIQAFLANIERQMAVKPSYDALKDDGNGTVTITNLTLTKPAKGEEAAITMKSAEAVFSGITDQGSSLYQVGKASFTNTSVEIVDKDVTLSASVPTVSAEGWYIRAVSAAPTPQEEFLATTTLARQMSSGPITLTTAGQTFTVDGFASTWNGDPATGAGKFTLKINNVAIPEAVVSQMDQGGLLKQLGYQTLNFDLVSDGDITRTGDNLGYAFNLSLSGRNIGSLSMGTSITDIPLAVYTAMMAAETNGKPADYAALSPQMQNILVNGASIRFEDASIVKKLLPLAAATQGMDEKTLLASIPPMVQLTLIQFQNEAFTKQAVDAISRFLAEPKSFTISAKPTAPLKLSDFNALDPNKPGDAITKLGITVTAND